MGCLKGEGGGRLSDDTFDLHWIIKLVPNSYP